MIVLAGLAIRVQDLDRYYFSPDDLLHLEISSGNSLLAVWNNAAEQMHPPLLYTILHILEGVTLDARFYRYLPLLPGIALIVALFWLGRVVSGDVAGLAAALVGAASVAGAILSQVIRPYCLLALLLCVGLIHFVLYVRHRRARDLACYGLLTVAAVLLHYGSAIQLTAISLVWAAGLVLDRAPRREWLRFAAVSVPPFVLLAGLYLWHASALYELYAAVQQSYLQGLFPSDPAGLWIAARGFFAFMLLPPAWWLGMLVAPLGVSALWRRSRPLALVVVSSAAINLILAWAERYPFGGSRHAFVLFPVLALTLGCAVQSVAEVVMSRIGSSAEGRRGRWLAGGAGTVLLLASIVAVWSFYDSHAYMRRSRFGGAEFPVAWDDYRTVMRRLDAIGPHDLVLANRQAGHYLLFETGYSASRVHSYRSKRLFNFTIVGADGRRLPVWVAEAELNFRDAAALTRSVDMLQTEVGVPVDATVWVVNIGWGAPIENIREEDPVCGELIEPEIVERGAQLYRLPGGSVRVLLGREPAVDP